MMDVLRMKKTGKNTWNKLEVYSHHHSAFLDQVESLKQSNKCIDQGKVTLIPRCNVSLGEKP